MLYILSRSPSFPVMANRLMNRRCIITGGASGIGLAIGRRFALEGASKIYLVSRSHDRLNKLKKAHEEEGLNQFEYWQGDVTKPEMWAELEEEVVSYSIRH